MSGGKHFPTIDSGASKTSPAICPAAKAENQFFHSERPVTNLAWNERFGNGSRYGLRKVTRCRVPSKAATLWDVSNSDSELKLPILRRATVGITIFLLLRRSGHPGVMRVDSTTFCLLTVTPAVSISPSWWIMYLFCIPRSCPIRRTSVPPSGRAEDRFNFYVSAGIGREGGRSAGGRRM